MFEYEGSMRTAEDILRIKNSKKEVIETPTIPEIPKEEIKKEVIETPKEEAQAVVTDELEKARADYKEIF
jgi:hypothetical protein